MIADLGSGDPVKGALPTFLVIGAPKCGTTSLHWYLSLHLDIQMSEPKELKLFSNDDWERFVPWYRAHFSEQFRVRGETSPVYTLYPRISDVPMRIHSLIPDARLIYIVRDPVERAIAGYVEAFALRHELRSLQEVADDDDPGNLMIAPSMFAMQLTEYRRYFDADRILIFDQRDLLMHRNETLSSVFRFLGVDPEFRSAEFDRLHNQRSSKLRLNPLGQRLQALGALHRAGNVSRSLHPVLRDRLKRVVASRVRPQEVPNNIRDTLAARLSDDAESFRHTTGRPFAHWSV